MVANYVLDSERLTSPVLRDAMGRAGLDHTQVGDMASILEQWALELIPLRGTLRGRPPISLAWWVMQRGYPVICVINQAEGKPDHNHAVVVVGMVLAENDAETEVFVLDPSAGKHLFTWTGTVFQQYWNSAGRVMLPMVEKVVQSARTRTREGQLRHASAAVE
jgi:hypothetical protein